MTFDEYWKGYWKPSGQPLIVDMAMKEIGQKAWEAAKAAILGRALVSFTKFTLAIIQLVLIAQVLLSLS